MGNMHSETMFSDSQFLSTYLTHPLQHSFSQLSDIVQTASSVSCIKNASTRKYLLTNQYHTEIAGLEPKEFVGLRVEDLVNCGLYEGGHAAGVKRFNELDSQVIASKSYLRHKEIFVTHQGFLKVHTDLRMPIIGQNNTVVAILSCEEDVTLRENPFELFKLYHRHYLPKEAIKKFLGYFEVDTCFQEMPGEAETHIIIAMLYDSHHKEVAKLLNRSHRTIAHHTWALSNKLKEGTTLAKVLKKMRKKWVREN